MAEHASPQQTNEEYTEAQKGVEAVHMDGPEELGKALDALADTFDTELWWTSPIAHWAAERHKAQGKPTYLARSAYNQKPNSADSQRFNPPVRFK